MVTFCLNAGWIVVMEIILMMCLGKSYFLFVKKKKAKILPVRLLNQLLLLSTPWRDYCIRLLRCKKGKLVYLKKLNGLFIELLLTSKCNLRVIRESGGSVLKKRIDFRANPDKV